MNRVSPKHSVRETRRRLTMVWRRKRPTAVVTIVGLVLLAGFLAQLFLPRAATYSVSAVTETASIVVRDERGVSVRLPDVIIWKLGAEEKNAQEICCSPALEVNDGVRIDLARKRTGDLLLQLNWSGRLNGARLVNRDGMVIPLASGDVLRVVLSRPSSVTSEQRIPETVLLGFRGELRVGDDVASFAERTLLSGTIKIVEGEFLSSGRFVAEEAVLDPGDAVEWRGRASPANISGFVHAGSGEGLQVVASAAANYMEVQRFGAPPYQVKASPWDRVTRDPVLNGVATVFLSLAALGTLMDLAVRLMDRLSDRKE